MRFLDEIIELATILYNKEWDERNGGNISYLLNDEDIKEIKDKTVKFELKVDFDMSYLIDKYFIVTGTGKYFRNVKKYPSDTLGIFKVLSYDTIGVVWGYENGGKPTSELPTHLKCHVERLKVDNNHRIVIHCHTTNIIAMTHVHTLNSNKFTETLWKMQTESIVVFPEGIKVLPWMLCGGNEIGDATANEMKHCRSVVWAQHGIFCTGQTIDETFGLIETIEKAAKIYIKIAHLPIKQSITNDQLICLAKEFKITYKKGIID